MTKRVKMCLKYKYATDMEIIRKRCGPCPRNVNSKCQIIPKPAKTRTIKGWGRWIYCGTESATFQAQSIKKFQCQSKKVFNFDIPCTILIDEKYLKGGKKC